MNDVLLPINVKPLNFPKRVMGIISLGGLFQSSIADRVNWFQNSMLGSITFTSRPIGTKNFIMT